MKRLLTFSSKNSQTANCSTSEWRCRGGRILPFREKVVVVLRDLFCVFGGQRMMPRRGNGTGRVLDQRGAGWRGVAWCGVVWRGCSWVQR
jgi:hypothetical protein